MATYKCLRCHSEYKDKDGNVYCPVCGSIGVPKTKD